LKYLDDLMSAGKVTTKSRKEATFYMATKYMANKNG
jgi:hypothetical protein